MERLNNMKYKREELFRYTFEKPIPALFQIQKIDEDSVTTSKGEARIIDISPEGIKLSSKLNIPHIDDKSIQLSISFDLNGENIHFEGAIVWKKEVADANEYGIDLVIEDTAKRNLIEQLKIHSKKAHGMIN